MIIELNDRERTDGDADAVAVAAHIDSENCANQDANSGFV